VLELGRREFEKGLERFGEMVCLSLELLQPLGFELLDPDLGERIGSLDPK
jgi:hypothetical protein